MKLLGHPFFHKSLLLGLSAIAMHSACSNSSFRGGSEQAQTEPASSEDATPNEDRITTSPIGTTEVQIPAALKAKPDSIYASFPTSQLKNAETRFTLDLKDVSSTFTLENKTAPNTDNFKQNNRLWKTETFTQGTPGDTKTDRLPQTAKGIVDILVVVDNSGSMAEEQNNLSTKLNDLLVSIKDANWQISVITTSPSTPGFDPNNANSEGKEACVSTLIKKQDVTAAADFAKAVQAGITGNGNEQGIRQAVVGLRCSTNKWVRADSTVAVLIVSDEDNCSLDGGDCGNVSWAKESHLISFVEGATAAGGLGRIVGKNAGFYGIVAPSKALCSTAGNPAPQYIRLFDYKASAPGANYGNICDASYKTTLNKISTNIALQLGAQFELKIQPDAGTLSLSVESATGGVTPVAATDYTVANTTITFLPGKEPAANSTLIATYRVNSKPLFNSVKLAEVPAPGTLTVKVNGTPLPANGFTLNGDTINFATQPVANATIAADFRQNTALIKTVKVSQTPVNGAVTVKVNNAATTAFTFDKNKNEVTLDDFPLDGQNIDVSYTFVTGPILTYKVPLMPGAKNFRVLDGATPLTVAVDEAATTVTINAGNFQAGKTLTFTFEAPDGAARKFPLIALPEAGTINISMMAGSCVFGKDLNVVGQELIATCPVTEKTDFILTYKFTALQKAFSLSGIANPDKGTWEVFYNGQPETRYTRAASTITLDFDPAAKQTVDVKYTFPE